MKTFLFRWFFTVWFVVSAALLIFPPSKYAWGEETGVLFFMATYILYAPRLFIGFLDQLTSESLMRSTTMTLFFQGGIFALGLDLLRMHIKKYRQYKRIALQMKK